MIDKKYIPLDKYWTIRMGVLDMLNGYEDITRFLSKQRVLGGDLKALKKASKLWKTKKSIPVGESGTIYRFLQFASWKLNLDKKLIKTGTLLHRKVCNNPEIVNWKLKELLKLDGGTSQWASASVLLGNKENIKNEPYFLETTHRALKYWLGRRRMGKSWGPKYDEILFKQANHFVYVLNSKKSKFIPNNPDDYCFARAFGVISKEYGEKHWPMIKHHESNRLVEMEISLSQAENGRVVMSKDHRVIQSIAMLYKTKHKKVSFKYRESVNKSWPQFWKFLSFYS